MVNIDKAHGRKVQTLAECMAEGVKYEDGFYWARYKDWSEDDEGVVVEFRKSYVWVTGNDHAYTLEDWVILEKLERKL